VDQANPLREIFRFGENVLDNAQTLVAVGEDRGEVMEKILRGMMNSAVGLKVKEYIFEEDFAKYTRPKVSAVGERTQIMKRRLAASDADSFEEFAGEYRHYTSLRRQAFDQVHNAIESARGGLKVPTSTIAATLKNEKLLSESAGGIPTSNFYTGKYISIHPDDFNAELEERYADDEVKYRQLKEWYERAYYSTEENIY
jgi:hypothetical protein